MIIILEEHSNIKGQNPIESADVDNCITLCVDCHKIVHQIPGCTIKDLRDCL